MSILKYELASRLSGFCQRMDDSDPDWEIAIFFGMINQYRTYASLEHMFD